MIAAMIHAGRQSIGATVLRVCDARCILACASLRPMGLRLKCDRFRSTVRSPKPSAEKVRLPVSERLRH
jgi:hypothetical protein